MEPKTEKEQFREQLKLALADPEIMELIREKVRPQIGLPIPWRDGVTSQRGLKIPWRKDE